MVPAHSTLAQKTGDAKGTARVRAKLPDGEAYCSPCSRPVRATGKTGSHSTIMRSRSTFAMIDAAAMEAERGVAVNDRSAIMNEMLS